MTGISKRLEAVDETESSVQRAGRKVEQKHSSPFSLGERFYYQHINQGYGPVRVPGSSDFRNTEVRRIRVTAVGSSLECSRGQVDRWGYGTERECSNFGKCRFQRGHRSSKCEQDEKNQLSGAPAIERAVPGVEVFELEVVFRSSHEGLRQRSFSQVLIEFAKLSPLLKISRPGQ